MILTSPDFRNMEMIPGDYGCDIITGEERDPFKPSPPLKWLRPPAKTRSFVLLVDDIDNDGFVHWLVANIPNTASQLEMDASLVAMPEGSVEYPNSYGGMGWGGPCPLGERHRYRFRLFALDVPSVVISIPELNITSLRSQEIQSQLDDRTLYVSVLTGDYQCPINLNASDIYPPPHPFEVPSYGDGRAPIEIRRYFKPSESFKKFGKNSGVYDSVEAKCKSGQLSAQLCKNFIENRPDTLVAPKYPQDELWDGDLPTISSDTASSLSPAERAARHVRAGGLQSINEEHDTLTLTVPTQSYPSINQPFYIGDWVSADTMTNLEIDNGNEPGQALVQGDMQVVDNITAANTAVSQMTDSLQKQAVENGCTDCHKNYIPPSRRRYSLTVRSPVFFACNQTDIPTSFGCDPSSPMSPRPSLPFSWRHAPAAARSLVLMMDDVTGEDVDALTFGLVHWLVVNIPPQETFIGLGASGSHMPVGSTELLNSFKVAGYSPPCPDDFARHRYRVRVYALPTDTVELRLFDGYKSSYIEGQLRPLVTASMELTYTKPTAGDGQEPATPVLTPNLLAAVSPKFVVKQASVSGPAEGPSFFGENADGAMNGR